MTYALRTHGHTLSSYLEAKRIFESSKVQSRDPRGYPERSQALKNAQPDAANPCRKQHTDGHAENICLLSNWFLPTLEKSRDRRHRRQADRLDVERLLQRRWKRRARMCATAPSRRLPHREDLILGFFVISRGVVQEIRAAAWGVGASASWMEALSAAVCYLAGTSCGVPDLGVGVARRLGKALGQGARDGAHRLAGNACGIRRLAALAVLLALVGGTLAACWLVPQAHLRLAAPDMAGLGPEKGRVSNHSRGRKEIAATACREGFGRRHACCVAAAREETHHHRLDQSDHEHGGACRLPAGICRVEPALPAGLSLNSQTCEVRGR
jgi:hypothetical protein